MTDVTHTLAVFALTTRWNDLPDKIQTEAVRAFVNYLGCALGGCRTPIAERAILGTKYLASSGTARVLGRTESFDPVNAAILNCIASAALT